MTVAETFLAKSNCQLKKNLVADLREETPRGEVTHMAAGPIVLCAGNLNRDAAFFFLAF